MNKLIKLLPPYERKSEFTIDLMNAQQLEFDRLGNDIKDLEKQLSIDTATWGLVIYEKDLGIETNLTKPLEERRSVIKSKERGTGKIDRTLIKLVVDAYTDGQVEVYFDGSIIVEFTSVLGTPPNIDDAKNAVGDIGPAHLKIIYKYMYLLIGDIHEVMTIEELEKMPMDKFAF